MPIIVFVTLTIAAMAGTIVYFEVSRAARTKEAPRDVSTSPRSITDNPAPVGIQVPEEPDAFERLMPVTFHNRNSRQATTAKLYLRAGRIDESAARQLDTLLADTRDPKEPRVATIDRRLLQLLYRTAYHFDAPEIEVTSAFRMRGRKREGLHALGRAVDFSIPKVKAEALASYLRTIPRVGVGIYTHRRTRFVHLDVREQSYHWLDASPPGRTWRGMSIGDKTLPARDAAYKKEADWPEGTM